MPKLKISQDLKILLTQEPLPKNLL